MRQNPIVRLPPEVVLNRLATWAYDKFNQWWPHGGGIDLCEIVPCVYINESTGEVIARADEMDSDEAEEQGLTIDHDPNWEGEEIARDEIRGKDKNGVWRTTDIVLRVENQPYSLTFNDRPADFWGYTSRAIQGVEKSPPEEITLVINWAKYGDGLDWLTFPHQYRAKGVAIIRGVLAHEMAHWLDPGRVTLHQPPDPRQPQLPWDVRSEQETYLLDVGEREALKRETFEWMKQAYLEGYGQKSAYGRAFPIDLLAKVRRRWPHIEQWFQSMDPKTRRSVLSDIGRAFYLFDQRERRRARLGRPDPWFRG